MTARVIDDAPPTLMLFCCGPTKCEHDYSRWVEYTDDTGVTTGTTVCAKCGAHAFDEEMWRDE